MSHKKDNLLIISLVLWVFSGILLLGEIGLYRIKISESLNVQADIDEFQAQNLNQQLQINLLFEIVNGKPNLNDFRLQSPSTSRNLIEKTHE